MSRKIEINKSQKFSKISIGLASPETILGSSRGEILKPETIKELVQEAKSHSSLAYFTNSTHNVYLTTRNETLSPEHVFNRQLTSSKGCITTDQIPDASKLKQLYCSDIFKKFVSKLNEF